MFILLFILLTLRIHLTRLSTEGLGPRHGEVRRARMLNAALPIIMSDCWQIMATTAKRRNYHGGAGGRSAFFGGVQFRLFGVLLASEHAENAPLLLGGGGGGHFRRRDRRVASVRLCRVVGNIRRGNPRASAGVRLCRCRGTGRPRVHDAIARLWTNHTQERL